MGRRKIEDGKWKIEKGKPGVSAPGLVNWSKRSGFQQCFRWLHSTAGQHNPSGLADAMSIPSHALEVT